MYILVSYKILNENQMIKNLISLAWQDINHYCPYLKL